MKLGNDSMYLVMVRKLTEDTFWYLHNSLARTTTRLEEAAEFYTREDALRAAEALDRTEFEIKLVQI